MCQQVCVCTCASVHMPLYVRDCMCYRACTCVHSCTQMRECTCVHKCMSVCSPLRKRLCEPTGAFVGAYASSVHMHLCVHCTNVQLCRPMRDCVSASACACAPVCMCAPKLACVHVCAPACHLHGSASLRVPACTYVHALLHVSACKPVRP